MSILLDNPNIDIIKVNSIDFMQNVCLYYIKKLITLKESIH